MAEVRLHANRVLRRRVLSDGSRRGIEGYFSLLHDERPAREHLLVFDVHDAACTTPASASCANSSGYCAAMRPSSSRPVRVMKACTNS